MGLLAYLFHFQPSELDDMDADALRFWWERAQEVSKYHGR